jgi:hypothetical protein
MSFDEGVTAWIPDLKGGDSVGAQKLWERYFQRLVGLPHPPEERRAITFPIEDDQKAAAIGIGIELLLSRLTRHVTQQPRHDVVFDRFQHAVIDRSLDGKKRLAQDIIDPVVRRASQAQPLAGYISVLPHDADQIVDAGSIFGNQRQ